MGAHAILYILLGIGVYTVNAVFSISFEPMPSTLIFQITTAIVRTPGGGGENNLIFSYIRRLMSFFWIQNFESQYFLGFSKKIIFLGYEYFVDFLGVLQNWTIKIFIGHLYAF